MNAVGDGLSSGDDVAARPGRKESGLSIMLINSAATLLIDGFLIQLNTSSKRISVASRDGCGERRREAGGGGMFRGRTALYIV